MGSNGVGMIDVDECITDMLNCLNKKDLDKGASVCAVMENGTCEMIVPRAMAQFYLMAHRSKGLNFIDLNNALDVNEDWVERPPRPFRRLHEQKTPWDLGLDREVDMAKLLRCKSLIMQPELMCNQKM
ncbi:hypothetical protein ACP4OV_013620 [Aristida adscensionis]